MIEIREMPKGVTEMVTPPTPRKTWWHKLTGTKPKPRLPAVVYPGITTYPSLYVRIRGEEPMEIEPYEKYDLRNIADPQDGQVLTFDGVFFWPEPADADGWMRAEFDAWWVQGTRTGEPSIELHRQ